MLSPHRIIPARAGFTGLEEVVAAVGEDHPRSRGVYRRRSSARRSRTGSSPLARGLLGVPPELLWQRRIIPARAGFTAVSSSEREAVPDHPRSRGVYWTGGIGITAVGGSSPLARGLQRGPGPLCGVRRIIPARAGFTSPRLGRLTSSRDHPRSRGVYASARPSTSFAAGSSPLARGLRGCTPRQAHVSPDHPRSRGVYRVLHSIVVARGGSSPLARGLLQVVGLRLADRGIIPARAGFT